MSKAKRLIDRMQRSKGLKSEFKMAQGSSGVGRLCSDWRLMVLGFPHLSGPQNVKKPTRLGRKL